MNTIHQIKISLAEMRPAIWRRLCVPSQISLADLHEVIQIAMPWQNYHLYQFIVNGELYGEPHPDDSLYGIKTNDAKNFTLQTLTPEPSCRFVYEYDFGDNWVHEILVEKIQPMEPSSHSPLCLEGARAAPPEDCGGPYGYMDLLDILADPKDEGYESMKMWAETQLDGPFKPMFFDRDRVNQLLKKKFGKRLVPKTPA